MLVINKSNTSTRFITTLTEVNANTSGSTIELFNSFTNVNSVFALPLDSSAYPTRFNQFDILTNTFSAITEGTYIYTIKDSTSGITETGLLKVVSDVLTQQEEVDSNYTYIATTSSDDDFIVYKK